MFKTNFHFISACFSFLQLFYWVLQVQPFQIVHWKFFNFVFVFSFSSFLYQNMSLSFLNYHDLSLEMRCESNKKWRNILCIIKKHDCFTSYEFGLQHAMHIFLVFHFQSKNWHEFLSKLSKMLIRQCSMKRIQLWFPVVRCLFCWAKWIVIMQRWLKELHQRPWIFLDRIASRKMSSLRFSLP